jgi:alpha-tubulin suppressor-like RCC1 family protein
MCHLSFSLARRGVDDSGSPLALILLVAALALNGCGGDGGGITEPEVASVTVSPADPSVSVGGTVQLTATPRDANGTELTGLSASWSSSAAGIAAVNASSGVVTGVAAGNATIRATVDGVEGQTNVTVTPTVASVSIDPSSAAVTVGGTVQLTATARDAGGNPLAGKAAAWSSDAPGTASVDPTSGVVTGVAPGAATITATIEGRQATAQITVAASTVATVTVDPSTATMHSGTTLQLTASAKDAGGNPIPGKVASWASNNPAVATVNSATGLVSGVTAGTAIITAAIEGKIANSTITVGAPAFLRIDTGENVSCGIITQSPGETVCWGSNFYGALGNENNSVQLNPGPITAPEAFTTVSAGVGLPHACGVSVTNVAYCWGSNLNGEVGENPNLPIESTPSAISGVSFKSVSAGNGSTCGVATSGAAYCWGAMSAGLGDAAGTTSSVGPVQVSGVSDFAEVSAGSNFACGLTVGGKIYCWGANDGGQLGRGNFDASATPVEVLGGRTYTVLSATHQHACAVATGGTAYCWGPNDNGQGGVGGQLGNSSEPTPVAGGHQFATISAGYLHGCGVTTDGQAYCWGSNSNGELGIGSNGGIETSPVGVAGGLTFASISAGSNATCGVTTGGDGYCWGVGALGDGTENGSDAPVQVKFGP